MAVLKASPTIAPMALPITVPLSFLVACLLTYGRFADENEFLALRMGGINPWHAISPFHHFRNFSNGLLDSGDAAYFVLFTTFFLLLTVRRLHNNRING